jgi:Ca2+:H+ antiporter
MMVPALFHALRPESAVVNEAAISFAIACLLMAVYALSLVFSLRTHRELFRGTQHEEPQDGHAEAAGSLPRAIGTLAVVTVFIAWMSEIMVGSVEEAAHDLGMSTVFVGVIIVATIGNAAEHSTAVLAAIRNRMDLSLSIAIGSSTQIALFVTPLLVILSLIVSPTPMDLVFTTGETFAVVMAAVLTVHTTGEGHSNWFTGALLLALYVILAVAFFHAPG